METIRRPKLDIAELNRLDEHIRICPNCLIKTTDDFCPTCGIRLKIESKYYKTDRIM